MLRQELEGRDTTRQPPQGHSRSDGRQGDRLAQDTLDPLRPEGLAMRREIAAAGVRGRDAGERGGLRDRLTEVALQVDEATRHGGASGPHPTAAVGLDL